MQSNFGKKGSVFDMNPFDVFLVNPIVNILVAIYQALSALGIPYALGFSIILLTVLIRMFLYPLITTQLRATKKMQELSPHLARIKEKHKGDSKLLQQETLRLYKEHGVNPAAGCLPLLIQMPVIWALYTVLIKVVGFNGDKVVSEVNKMVYPGLGIELTAPWDQHFFGIPLGESPAALFSTSAAIALSVPLFTAFFQFVQSKMIFHKPQDMQEKALVKKGEEKEKKSEDFASIMQTQSLYIFPVMIGFFSYTLPFGLSLYWNAFTIFGILQQYKVHGPGGISPLLDFLKGKINK